MPYERDAALFSDPHISHDLELVDAVLSIQKSGGVVSPVRTDQGVHFVSGSIEVAGSVVADLINLKWIVSDGRRNYRLNPNPEVY